MEYRQAMLAGGGRPINYQAPPDISLQDLYRQHVDLPIEQLIETHIKPTVKNFLKGQQKLDNIQTDLFDTGKIYDLLKYLYNTKDNNYSPSIYGIANLKGIQD